MTSSTGVHNSKPTSRVFCEMQDAARYVLYYAHVSQPQAILKLHGERWINLRHGHFLIGARCSNRLCRRSFSMNWLLPGILARSLSV
jgi:hypothetical protein